MLCFLHNVLMKGDGMTLKRWMLVVGWIGAEMLGFGDTPTSEIHGAPAQQARAEILWTRAICKQPGGMSAGRPPACEKTASCWQFFPGTAMRMSVRSARCR